MAKQQLRWLLIETFLNRLYIVKKETETSKKPFISEKPAKYDQKLVFLARNLIRTTLIYSTIFINGSFNQPRISMFFMLILYVQYSTSWI